MTDKVIDSAELRAARLEAYRAGAYRFSAPSVTTRAWTPDDWCNFVQFDNRALCGYLPREGSK